MTQERIYNALITKGYQDKAASILSEDLSRINSALESCLISWVESGEEVDYTAGGFSIKGLMHKFQLQYPAALLSIDWVIKEPELATVAINKGVR